MSRVRFLIEVKAAGGGWDVTVTGPGLERRRRMESVDDGVGGRFPAPAEDACPAADPNHGECLRGGEAVRDAHEQVAVERAPRDRGAITRLGRYLFDALLGQDTWRAIAAAATAAGAELVELALSWDPDDHALHRLNWELLHNGQQFLAEGCGRADVAITRVVPSSSIPDRGSGSRTPDGPPRVLFAIGAAVHDEDLRPGAEALGLVRHAERDGRPLHHHTLEAASPERLARAMKEFRPHVVQFICHGEVHRGESVLLLPSDEPDQPGLQRRDASQLLQSLKVDGELPRLVVISACQSGPAARLLGGHETAPLAAKLVQGGIPVVVGMAGDISDLACRLFTRSFGEALVGGGSLVEASARARRAGLVGGAVTSSSVDWASPAVFMDADVDPTQPLAPTRGDATAAMVDGWVSSYGLNEEPVFYGRTEFLDTCWRMLHGDRVQVLAAFVRGGGLGRTRLLKELARQALRDGHIPVLLGTNPREEPPRDVASLCRAVATAMARIRSWLDLPPRPDSQLGLLSWHDPARPPDLRLDGHIAAWLPRGGEVMTPDIAKRALQLDLERLISDARDRHPELIRDSSRVIVLLDGVNDSSIKLVEALHDEMLGDHGLGRREAPVPVVLAFSLSGQGNLLREIAEGRSGKPWLGVRELRPFQADGEDLLAYEQVMLHPFNVSAMPGVSDLPWMFNRGLEERLKLSRVALMRQTLKGKPIVFREPTFHIVLAWASAKPDPFVSEVDDRRRLEELAKLRKAEPS